MVLRFRQIEIFPRALLENHRREGAERLAEFYFFVDDALHLGAPRISKNAAVPQRTRAPFKSAFEPAKGFSLGELIRHAVQHQLLVVDALVWDTVGSQGIANRRVRKRPHPSNSDRAQTCAVAATVCDRLTTRRLKPRLHRPQPAE